MYLNGGRWSSTTIESCHQKIVWIAFIGWFIVPVASLTAMYAASQGVMRALSEDIIVQIRFAYKTCGCRKKIKCTSDRKYTMEYNISTLFSSIILELFSCLRAITTRCTLFSCTYLFCYRLDSSEVIPGEYRATPKQTG